MFLLADICKSREKENRFKWADIRREKIVLNEQTSAGNEKREDRFKWADMWIERERKGEREKKENRFKWTETLDCMEDAA